MASKESGAHKDGSGAAVDGSGAQSDIKKNQEEELLKKSVFFLKDYLNGDKRFKPYYKNDLIVESPKGSKKLGIWKDNEFLEFAGKESEIEWR